MISISVVMPTYNVPVVILREAVESILSQTFCDFEFIIIDDGSTNGSYEYLHCLDDERIRLIRNPNNLGITKSLNIGFREAKGKYIARMDSDDIALSTRFEKQFAFMESHQDVIVCGTNVEFIGARSGTSKCRIIDMDSYRIRLLFSNPGPYHPTAFFNRELLRCHHVVYDEKLEYAQDYGLWVKISRHGKMFILEDVLLRYRVHSHQLSQVKREKQFYCDKITKEQLLRELLGNVTKDELDFHFMYSSGYFRKVKVNNKMLNWYRRLIETNDLMGIYDRKKFKFCVYNYVVKRAIYQSFDTDMSYTDKIGVFFQYLPISYALRAAAGMSARGITGATKKILKTWKQQIMACKN